MGNLRRSDRACERAQAWASLDVDGELSQLERALLAAHLRRCAACADARAEVHALSELVRGAPLDVPARPLFVPSEPRARGLALRLAAAATLAALAAGLGVLAGSVGDGDGAPSAPEQTDIALLPSPDAVRDRRGLRPPPQPAQQPLVPEPSRLGGV
jgi:predicted anti-sigma-YlaC factor YlaD